MTVGVFTPVFPNAMPFVEDYFDGITRQEYSDFTLWLALDRLEPADVATYVPDGVRVEIVPAREDDTPARLRDRVWSTMATAHDVVVMVDSDDIPGPLRVSDAVEACGLVDVNACALDIIDEDGELVGATLRPPEGVDPADHVLEWNVFGLSNTAFTGKALERLLPLPSDVKLVDWFLFTLANSLGLNTSYTYAPHLAYRQYAANTARILPPLSASYLRTAADLVAKHLSSAGGEIDRRGLRPLGIPERLGQVKDFANLDAAELLAVASEHAPSGDNCYLWWEYVAPDRWVARNRTDEP